MMRNKKLAGAMCGIITGICWGLSGVFSQYLFTNTDMDSNWFVSVRILVSGFFMMFLSLITKKDEIRKLLKNKKDLLRCFFSGVLGTMMFQLACYGTVQRSNAATAIVLQYLCPVMVMIYVCFKNTKLPEKQEVFSLSLAVAGIFLISTHGNIHQLVMSEEALIWGIGCAFFMMLSTTLPEPLYRRYSSQTITSAMLFFAGITAAILINPMENTLSLDWKSLTVLTLAVVSGSIMAYIAYGLAIKQIGSVKASLYACVEIPTATMLSLVFMGTHFSFTDFIGFAMIGSTVFLLSLKE